MIWRLSWLAVEWPWSVLAGPILTLLAQCRNPLPSPCISGTIGSFQSGGAFVGWKALTIESLLMSMCGQCHEPSENGQLSSASFKQKWKYGPKKVKKTSSDLMFTKTNLPCQSQTTLVLRHCHKGVTVQLSSYTFMVQVITMQRMIVYISSSYKAIHAWLLRTFTWSDGIGQTHPVQ